MQLDFHLKLVTVEALINLKHILPQNEYVLNERYII